eukprot:8262962-Pyramimonas_sp.AAC.1
MFCGRHSEPHYSRNVINSVVGLCLEVGGWDEATGPITNRLTECTSAKNFVRAMVASPVYEAFGAKASIRSNKHLQGQNASNLIAASTCTC